MQKAVAPRELDNKAFKDLEDAGSRKGSRRRIVLTADLRTRLRLVVRRYSNFYAFVQTYSPEAIDRIAAVAALAPGALKDLQSREWELRQVVYGEGTAMAMCIDGVSSGDPASDELFASVPLVIKSLEELVKKAEQRLLNLDERFSRNHPRRAVHNEEFAREVAEIFRLAGGKPGFGKRSEGPFARFLEKLWNFLPRGRPNSPSALVAHCRDALKNQEHRQIKRRVLHALKGGAKTADELRTSVGSQIKQKVLNRSLALLRGQGLVSPVEQTSGKLAVTWHLLKTPETVERESESDSALDGAVFAAMRAAGLLTS